MTVCLALPEFIVSAPCCVQGTWTSVRFPQKGNVYDYYVNWKAAKFAPWCVTLACRSLLACRPLAAACNGWL